MELCNNVAAHVHADTIPEAIRPGLMLREAVLNSSLVLVLKLVYLFCRCEIPIMSLILCYSLQMIVVVGNTHKGKEEANSNDDAIAGACGQDLC